MGVVLLPPRAGVIKVTASVGVVRALVLTSQNVKNSRGCRTKIVWPFAKRPSCASIASGTITWSKCAKSQVRAQNKGAGQNTTLFYISPVKPLRQIVLDRQPVTIARCQ